MHEYLLINPNVYGNRNLPNMAAAYAATFLNCKVIDLNTKPEPALRYLDFKTKCLLISTQSRGYSESMNIAKKYLEKYPETKVMSVLTTVDGECCYPFVPLKGYEVMEIDIDFTNPPFPKFELFDSFPIYLKNWRRGLWNYPIFTSLGCPYQCIYCARRNTVPIKFRDLDSVVAELKHAKEKYGIKTFEILDDCFNVNKNRVLEFCEKVKPLGLKFACVNGLRADRLDEDIAKAMKEAGCFYIGFGIESTDPKVLERIKKGETIEQIENAIYIAKKYFKRIAGFFIIGLPESSYETDLRSLNWALKRGITTHFSFYIPFDKTPCLDVYGNIEGTFHGEKSYPVVDTYSPKLQARIYRMTECMRNITIKNLPKKLFVSIPYFFFYNPKMLPYLLFLGPLRIVKRFLMDEMFGLRK